MIRYRIVSILIVLAISVSAFLEIPVSAQTPDYKPAQLLYEGSQLLQDGRFNEALTKFDQVISKYPQSPETPRVIWMAADFLIETESLVRARNYLEKLTTGYPGSQESSFARIALARLGLASLKLSDLEAAEKILGESIPGTMNIDVANYARIGLAECHIRRRQFDLAEVDLIRILLHQYKGPTASEALQAYALLCLLKGQPVDAMLSLQRMKSVTDDSSKIPAIDESLTLLTKLYVLAESRLHCDPLAEVKDRMEEPLDIQFDDQRKLWILGKNGVVTVIDPSKPARGETRQNADVGLRLNAGYMNQCLVIGENMIFENKTLRNLYHREPLKRIVDAVWTSPGEYWVLDRKYKGIRRFDSSGKFMGQTGDFSIKGGERMAVSPLGGTWILHPQTRKIYRFDAFGNMEVDIPFQGAGYSFTKPVDIASDQFGHLYVLDPGSETIYIFNPLLKKLRSFSYSDQIIRLRKPVAMVVGKAGDIFIADAKSNTIYRLY